MQKRRRRREFTIGLLSLGLLVGVALTASPAQADSSNGPYYAEPAWDQKLDSATRFVVLTNWNSQAVLDRETGLVWEKSPLAIEREWNNARDHCVRTSFGGRAGWRLQTVTELASLMDPAAASGPKLPPGHPFTNVQLSAYWSATEDARFPDTVAWIVNFSDGGLPLGAINTTTTALAWCVRGGTDAGVY